MTTQFSKDIQQFNKMYGMPYSTTPQIPFKTSTANGGTARKQLLDRLAQFRKMLEDEVKEVEFIEEQIVAGEPPVEILTLLADWLGDIQIFCASEMARFGLNNEMVLSIIMASNFSKLQADGTALYVDGKLQKGPNYWKPEPKLKRMIELEISNALFVQAEATQQADNPAIPPVSTSTEGEVK